MFTHIVSPKVTAEPYQYVVQGNTATIRCNVTGNPIPEQVVWKRNGSVLINPGEKYGIPSLGLLTINDAREEDAGIYECFAGTNLGSDKTSITLIVLSKCMCFYQCLLIASYIYCLYK